MPSHRHDSRLMLPERLEGRRLLAAQLQTNDVSFEIGPIAADPTRNLAYVVDQTRGLLLAVDTNRGGTVQVAALAGRAASVAVAPKGRRLYVAEPGAFQVEVFALPDLKRITRYSLAGNPSTIVAGAGGRLYGKASGSQIAQYDAATGVEIARFASSNAWYSLDLATASGGTRLYTRTRALSGSGGSCEEFAIDGPTPPRLVKVHPVPLANSQGFAVDGAARRIYTADGGVYGVGVTNMDTGDQTVWASATGPYGSGVATREGLDRVWGFHYDGITEYAKETGLVRATYPTPSSAYPIPQSTVVTANGNLLFASRSYASPDTGGSRLSAIGFSTNDIGWKPVANQFPYAAYTATVGASGRIRLDAADSWIYESGEAITTYAWDFGDGSVGSRREAEHAYATGGSYQVKLVVTASNGRQDTLVKTIDVPAFVTGLAVPSAGHYRIGSQLEFQVTFSDSVRAAAGATIPIQIGTETRQATLLPSRSTPTSLTFAYTVALGDWSASGIALPPAIAVPAQGSITDAGGKAVSLRLPGVDASRVLVGIAAPQPDVDGNGVPDLVWKNADGSAMAMLDGDPGRPRQLGGGDGWQFGGIGDFNGDGISDPIWYHSDADRYVLRLSKANGELLAAADLGGDGWAVESTVDRNGDGKADLTWRDRNSGLTVVWIMDGLTAVSSRTLGGDQTWRLVPTGEQFDANRDGVADVVWRHTPSGTTVLWTIVDGLATSTKVLDGGAGWSLVAAGDFDGNGFGDTV